MLSRFLALAVLCIVRGSRTVCPAGYYQESLSSDACVRCETGFYSGRGFLLRCSKCAECAASACAALNSSSLTTTAAAAAATTVASKKRMLNSATTTAAAAAQIDDIPLEHQCPPCAEGECPFCTEPYTAASAEALGWRMCDKCLPGHSQSGETYMADCVQCLEPGWCQGVDGNVTNPGGYCTASLHRTNAGCIDCVADYAPSGGECIECPNIAFRFGPPLLLLLLAVVLLRKVLRSTAAALKHELEEKTGLDMGNAETVKSTARSGVGLMRQMAAMMSLLSFAQVSTTLVGMDLSWPTEVKVFADYLGRIVDFNVYDVVNPACFLATGTQASSFFSRWALTMMLPMGCIGVLLFLGFLLRPCSCCAPCARKRNSFRHLALGIYLVTFTLIARSATQPLDCVTVADPTEEHPNPPAFMRSNPAVQCGSSLPDYRKYFILGVMALVLVVAGMVCLVRVLRAKVAALGGDGWGLRSDEGFVQAFGVLYLRYDPRHYYWEVVVLARKLAIVLSQQLLAESPTAQITVCAITLLASLIAQCCCKPYLSSSLDQVEELMLTACVVILVVGTASHTGAVSEMTTSCVYFATLGVAGALAAVPLRKIWTGKDVVEGSSGGAAAGEGGGDGDVDGGSAVAHRGAGVPSKKYVV